jgi:hypothetical protein
MKRTDFLKTLGALIISPLAINSILKDNEYPNKRQQTDFSGKCLNNKKYGISVDVSSIPDNIGAWTVVNNFQQTGEAFYYRNGIKWHIPYNKIP